MKFWDYAKHPFRPVAPHSIAVKQPDGSVIMVEQPPDVFLDALGRNWFAGTDILRAKLATIDPTAVKTVSPIFWHPDSAREHSEHQHQEQKRELEDARADLAIPKAREWVR